MRLIRSLLVRSVPSGGMKKAFTGLSEDEVATMPGGIAGCFYGVDLKELPPHAARVGPEKSYFPGSVSELVDTRAS